LEALDDPLLKPALEAFFRDEAKAHLQMLILEIHKHKERDFYRESELKGKVEAYETALLELKHFAQRQMKEATG